MTEKVKLFSLPFIRGVFNFADSGALMPLSDSVDGQEFAYRGEWYKISLAGEHQLKNAAVALEAVACLRRAGFDHYRA